MRYANVFGPRQDPKSEAGVVSIFVSRLLAGEPLTVFGDGRQTRCFCHVNDVVEALLGLLEEPSAEGDVFNVGSMEEVTILELAEAVIRATKSPSTVQLVPYERAYEGGFEDMRRRIPDVSKIRALTGWQPTSNLDDIIADVVASAQLTTPQQTPVMLDLP
jgi:UDP-glucose 4-epimerase